MANFLKSAASQFGHWVEPLAIQGNDLGRLISGDPNIDEKVKSAFLSWSQQARENYAQIKNQLEHGYGLPELEYLRIEACFCIIQGYWQGSVCLTNILLEEFLKLALVYSNTDEAEEQASPLSQIMKIVAAPTGKYMRLNLYKTIDLAHEQGLISEEKKDTLDKFRKRFRNAFFHADMQSMFEDQTTPITGVDFGSFEIEGPSEVPIHSLPLLLGEAMWQNARANAIPYFKEVDALIRETLPKVFPGFEQEQSENTIENARQGEQHGESG